MNQTITREHPFRACATVDVSFVMEQFRPIILWMEALISNADSTAYRAFDRDAMFMRLFEAADHHLAFELGRKQGNVGFDFYIQEYGGQFAKYLNDAEFLRAGGIYFANAVGYLARCLDMARQEAENLGAVVTEVDGTPYIGMSLFTYIVTASFDNHLYDFVPGSMTY